MASSENRDVVNPFRILNEAEREKTTDVVERCKSIDCIDWYKLTASPEKKTSANPNELIGQSGQSIGTIGSNLKEDNKNNFNTNFIVKELTRCKDLFLPAIKNLTEYQNHKLKRKSLQGSETPLGLMEQEREVEESRLVTEEKVKELEAETTRELKEAVDDTMEEEDGEEITLFTRGADKGHLGPENCTGVERVELEHDILVKGKAHPEASWSRKNFCAYTDLEKIRLETGGIKEWTLPGLDIYVQGKEEVESSAEDAGPEMNGTEVKKSGYETMKVEEEEGESLPETNGAQPETYETYKTYEYVKESVEVGDEQLEKTLPDSKIGIENSRCETYRIENGHLVSEINEHETKEFVEETDEQFEDGEPIIIEKDLDESESDTDEEDGEFGGNVESAIDSGETMHETNVNLVEALKLDEETGTETNVILVEGLKPSVDEEMLELFFENTKRSGGGEIQNIQMNQESGTALIWYKEAEVARRVAAGRRFTVGGCELSVEPFQGGKQNFLGIDGNIEGPRTQRSCTIEVSGVSTNTAPEILKLYLENRRRSGGGEVERIWCDKSDGRYVVSFVSIDAVERIMDKPRHTLAGSLLNIRVLRSPEVNAEIHGPVERDKVYILGLDDEISRDLLELHLEKLMDCDVTEVEYGLDPSVAMVTCNQDIDFTALENTLCRKPLQGRMLSWARVVYTRSLQVWHIGVISADSLSLYFETRRSGGSGDVEVVIHPEYDCAIVTFESHQVAQNVLSRGIHRYDGRELEVRVYREKLGLTPPGFDPSRPCPKLPSETYISGLDRNKVEFLKTIPNVLKKINAAVDWENYLGAELCVMRIANEDTKSFDEGWVEKVESSITSILSEIAVERVGCDLNAWKGCCAEVKKLNNGKKTVVMLEKPKECTFYIVGRTQAVNAVRQVVEKICDEVAKRTQYVRYALQLTHMENRLLEKVKALDELQSLYPDVEFTHNGSEGVALFGAPENLLAIQEHIFRFLRKTSTAVLKMSNGKLYVLTMLCKQTDTVFKAAMENLRIVLTIEEDCEIAMKKSKFVLEGSSAIIFGLAQDVEKCAKVLTDCVIETEVPVTEEERSVFEGDDRRWHHFYESLVMRCGDVLYIKYLKEKSVVYLAAFISDVDGISAEVKEYIKMNTLRKAQIDISPAQKCMLTQCMEGEVIKVEKQLERYYVKITFPADNDNIEVTGVKDGLEAAETSINGILSKIVTDTYSINSPGMPHFFTQDIGWVFILSLERKYQVIIRPEVNPRSAKVKATAKVTPDQQQPTAKKIYDVTHTSGVKVKVIHGDVTSHKVDVIVNAANAQLAHIGGLAKAIVDKGGPCIQEESNKYIEEHGPLMEGHAALLGPGDLPCKAVLHAVGPRWRGGRFAEADTLYDCVFSHVMKTTFAHSFCSVAIPAISSGVFRAPVAMVTTTVAEAVRDFLDTMPEAAPRHLVEVHFIDNRLEVAKTFMEAVKKAFEKKQSAEEDPGTSSKSGNISSEASTSHSHQPQRLFGGLRLASAFSIDDRASFSPKFPFASDQKRPIKSSAKTRSAGVFESMAINYAQGEVNLKNKQLGTWVTNEAVNITLKEGDIAEENADLLVNTVGSELDLKAGAVSRALLAAAGEELQAEVRLNTPEDGWAVVRPDLAAGEYVVTGPGNIKHCRGILHAVLEESNDETKIKQVLENITCATLMHASKSGYKSVALPAMGTGNLHFPPGVVAKTMFNSVIEFSKNNPGTKIHDVRFVLYNGDHHIIDAFSKQMKTVQKSSSESKSIIKKLWREFCKVSSSPVKFGFLNESDESSGSGGTSQPDGLMEVEYSAQDKSASVLKITILATSQSDIEAVKADINQCIDEQSADNYISGPLYSEVIKKLSPGELLQIKLICQQNGVKLTNDLGHRVARMRLQGQVKDVYRMESKVKESLHKVKVEISEQEHNEMLTQLVLWEYKDRDSGQFLPYPADVNSRLEKAHSNGEVTVEWEDEAAGVKVNLKAKTETNGLVTKDIRRRVIPDKDAILTIPEDWTDAPGPVELKPTDPDYLTVSQEFGKTCPSTIVKIERIQNKYLYRRYMVHKAEIEGRETVMTPFERKLWHGTTADAVDSINTNGFNRSYCGQNGTAYGQGVYFAESAQGSSGYAKSDARGYHKMYYARVLTGDYTHGNGYMKTPPSRNDPHNPSRQYDSTVDARHGAPSIFVIYYDTQAYPEYIVTFR